MPERKRQNFLHGAAVLTVSALIIKILGAVYKIPLYNILDDKGIADFNITYNIYNVLLMLSTAGLPVAVSRLIAEADALGKTNQVRRIFKVALTAFVILGSAGTLVMLIFSTQLAIAAGNVQSAPGIFVMAPAVLLVCILSAYRGWEQGHSNMIPTSVTQVIEVAVKVIFGLVIAWFLTKSGEPESRVAAGSIVGVPLGTLAACIYIIIYGRRSRKGVLETGRDVPDSSLSILKRLFSIGIPIALGAAAMSIIQLMDSTIITHVLQNTLKYTLTETRALYGSYSKLLSLHNLPWFFVTPFTVSLVPAISANLAKKNHAQTKYVTEVSLRVMTVISLPMAVGMAALAYPVANVLYYGKTMPDSSMQLAILAIASYFMCMALTMTSILQAMGKEKLSLVSLVTGGVVKVGVNFLLISIPSININGAVISTIICYLIMTLMNYVFIRKNLREKIRASNIFLRPAISAVLMGIAAWAIYSPLSGVMSGGGELTWLPMAAAMCISIFAGVVVYLVMIIATGAVTLDDIKLIPKGEKIAKFLRIK